MDMSPLHTQVWAATYAACAHLQLREGIARKKADRAVADYRASSLVGCKVTAPTDDRRGRREVVVARTNVEIIDSSMPPMVFVQVEGSEEWFAEREVTL